MGQPVHLAKRIEAWDTNPLPFDPDISSLLKSYRAYAIVLLSSFELRKKETYILLTFTFFHLEEQLFLNENVKLLY